MRDYNECGQTTAEAVVALAIFALFLVAVADAAILAASAGSHDVERNALRAAVQRELPLAADILKYRSSRLVPATAFVLVPLPAGSPLPARISLTVASLADGRTEVTIRAVASDASAQESGSEIVPVPAPLPGSAVEAPRTAAQPTGAP